MWKQIREMCKCVCVFSAQHYGSTSHTELCSNSVLFIKKVCFCEHWQLLRSTEIMVLFCCSLNRNTPQVTNLIQSPLRFITCGLGEGIWLRPSGCPVYVCVCDGGAFGSVRPSGTGYSIPVEPKSSHKWWLDFTRTALCQWLCLEFLGTHSQGRMSGLVVAASSPCFLQSASVGKGWLFWVGKELLPLMENSNILGSSWVREVGWRLTDAMCAIMWMQYLSAVAKTKLSVNDFLPVDLCADSSSHLWLQALGVTSDASY